MIRYHASWVVPVAGPPIRDGWVDVGEGRVLAIGSGQRPGPGDDRYLDSRAILPGLVNAHTHLELSFLHARVPPSASFNDWVTGMMALRRASGLAPTAPPIVDAARLAILQAHRSGTVLIGDISNSLAVVSTLRNAGMPAQVFHELTGFNLSDPSARVRQAREGIDAARAGEGDVRISMAPHAPYSVSPALFRAIRADVNGHAPAITSVHLGESQPEVELLRHGTGVMRTMLETLGAWTESWRAPGVSPVQYLEDLGFLDARTLVVHGVQFDRSDLSRVRALGATLVSCPRSNVYVGVGSPPLATFYDAGVRVAFGTDSLASVDDLDMFAELREARRISPGVAASRLLESATKQGAVALGFQDDYGTIEPGKRARLLTVPVPDGVDDVEEYLVGSVHEAGLRWIEEI